MLHEWVDKGNHQHIYGYSRSKWPWPHGNALKVLKQPYNIAAHKCWAKYKVPSTFSHSMQRLASTWNAAQAMVATFCFLVCFSLELQSLWLLRLQSWSINWTRPLRTRHCSSLLKMQRIFTYAELTFNSVLFIFHYNYKGGLNLFYFFILRPNYNKFPAKSLDLRGQMQTDEQL